MGTSLPPSSIGKALRSRTLGQNMNISYCYYCLFLQHKMVLASLNVKANINGDINEYVK